MDRSHLPSLGDREVVGAELDIRDQQAEFPAREVLRAPKGAPNVLVVLIDDMGFGASSAFGGPCPMPTAERLADNGLRYSRFHTTALCSPTRAALLTGRNHHTVGMGNVLELATPAPGYDGMRPPSAGTLAQTLNANGYATGAFGKWRQTPPWEQTAAGPFDRWPTREGFEKFYGILAAESNQLSRRASSTGHVRRPAGDRGGGLPLLRGPGRPAHPVGGRRHHLRPGAAVVRLPGLRCHARPLPPATGLAGQAPW